MAVVMNFSTKRMVLFNLLLVFLRVAVYANTDPPYSDCHGEKFIEDRTDMDTVYGLFLCYNYVYHDTCTTCAEAATKDITNLCGKSKQALVWKDTCQLRYSNQNFFGHLDVAGNVNQTNPKRFLEPDRLKSTLKPILLNISKQAAYSSDMIATAYAPFSVEPIYAFGQCTKDLSPDDCSACLEAAISNLSSCCYYYRGARLYSRSCFLRYEFHNFTDATPQMPKHSARKNKWTFVVLSFGAAAVLVALIGVCIYCLALRNQLSNRRYRVSRPQVQLPETSEHRDPYAMLQKFQALKNLDPQEFPLIPIESVRVATDDFSDSNKLGQGGFGPVYKGTLSTGENIAVKRLSATSTQGSSEFINEVLLIFKLQHKNLVRLLGFCIDGEERILIYEYMSNSSLDVFLNDESKRAKVSWTVRLDIINGIARGMLECQANSTVKIVGTYGYIAPEFAMEGLYSIKSDVFSFGVLLLEIISGKRNADFHLSTRTTSLLAYAWRLWNDGKGKDLMDPLLADTCCLDDFLRCMHIGLLCVQEDSYDRPTMVSVVMMLNCETTTLRQPERPAYSIGRLPNHQKTCYNNFSINDLSISNAYPR
ncbi:Cysteine-rich receptor-like protein kinase 25 [Heracleum sosnowskyi]|uniref:non-specific serine/threonine protein kinase n=1 Tax=Heracleum sosnowskyi TaxID=360622 RepID=A0AAD8HJN8_9APIA|nr:Cysteine-rich receptor-like protein kinase 25 [Heracleum sosnowskyi]